MISRTGRTGARILGLLLLSAALPTAQAKVVRGTPQQPKHMGSISTANANDLSNASAATPQDEAFAKASAALDAAAVKARGDFEQTPVWTDAAATYDTAREALAADTAAAINKLSADAAYQTAVAARDEAQSALDALHAAGTASPASISTAAASALTARAAVTSLQTQAVSADPAVLADRPPLAAALKTMNELRIQEQQAVQTDPDWKVAKKTYDAAKSAAAASHKK